MQPEIPASALPFPTPPEVIFASPAQCREDPIHTTKTQVRIGLAETICQAAVEAGRESISDTQCFCRVDKCPNGCPLSMTPLPSV
jgi:hypothetical protein